MPATRKPSRKGLSRLELNVLSTVEEYQMVQPGQRITVACSGGADSVALLFLLHNLSKRFGWVISVAHFNHLLRGTASNDDEAFVAQLAADLGLEFFCDRADVRKAAQRSRTNLEATARRLRYDFFRTLVASGSTDRVAVAHTADDQAETMLLRLIRGAGLRGLAAIRPVLVSGIVRPLIAARREDLRRWLVARTIAWREDQTNQDLQYRRNLVRHTLLPALTAVNPAVVDTLARTARLCQLDEAFWRSYVSVLARRYATTENGEARIELSALRRLPRAASLRLLQHVIEASAGAVVAADYAQLSSLLDWATARRVRPLTLPRNLAARKDSQHLIIATDRTRESSEAPGYTYQLAVPSAVDVVRAGIRCALEFIDMPCAPGAYNGPGFALLNRSLLKFPLTLRNWKPGDAFRPKGRHKSRKLKELFQRHRVPPAMRRGWPVMESAGKIVWAKDFGVAEGVAPQPSSRQAVLLTYSSLTASNCEEHNC